MPNDAGRPPASSRGAGALAPCRAAPLARIAIPSGAPMGNSSVHSSVWGGATHSTTVTCMVAGVAGSAVSSAIDLLGPGHKGIDQAAGDAVEHRPDQCGQRG